MTKEQIVLAEIKKNIRELSAADAEAVEELAAFFRMNIKRAGSPVGPYAIALVGAQMSAEA